MRLLRISRAELVEQMIKDRRGGQTNDFQTDLGCNGCRICLCACKIEVRAKQVNGAILKSDCKDVT